MACYAVTSLVSSVHNLSFSKVFFVVYYQRQSSEATPPRLSALPAKNICDVLGIVDLSQPIKPKQTTI